MIELNLGIIGFGIVGKALTLGFRKKGNQVFVNDIHEKINEKIYSKKQIVQNSEVIFICVNTPTIDGKPKLQNLIKVFDKILGYCEKNQDSEKKPVIVIKSTVPPGTTQNLSKRYKKVVMNPEFLREKNALDDFLYPDRIVIGSNNARSIAMMKELYSSWECPKIITEPTSAEVIKYLSNTYLVYKVAFSQLALDICNLFEVDADEIMDVVTLDHRIHPSHLKPSLGKIPLDSHCLPKDISALIHTIGQYNGDTKYLEAIKRQGIKNDK